MAHKRDSPQGTFFAQGTFFSRDNYIHGFRSKTLESWEDLGPIVQPWNNQQRLCAGSALAVDKTIYFFGSYTFDIVPKEILDQRLYLTTSKNGYEFSKSLKFRLEPDPAWYGTKRTHPVTNEMVFAWRDPFIFQDPPSGRYYLFICAGAKRWGVPPTVAVAVAENIMGPYELLPPAVDMTVKLDGKNQQALGEIERIQIVYRNNKYYMLFSCWPFHVNQDFARCCQSMGHSITESTIYILSSDQVTGPYRLDLNCPTVKNSAQTGLYGIYLITPRIEDADESILTGWFPEHFTVCVTDNYRVVWEEGNIHVKEARAIPAR
ncbi:hypothetical protein [Candidatus Thiosymbion oneisti]|uniref:hypothetical protein n=1 Tax=Candidatus Thiosymbion oneisti TaxID=589554 RepID=UPI00114D39E5|nr:hypothetical protein [Candidatus Thiosymbion oneisti]